MIQLALSGNPEVAKMIAPNLFGGAIKPTYFTGPSGQVFGIDPSNPMSASPVMTHENKPLTNAIYDDWRRINGEIIAKSK